MVLRAAPRGRPCRTALAAAPGPGIGGRAAGRGRGRPGCVVGPHLPGADADARAVVARTAVVPPVRRRAVPQPAGRVPQATPSPTRRRSSTRPAAGHRAARRARRVRFATLDAYDGVGVGRRQPRRQRHGRRRGGRSSRSAPRVAARAARAPPVRRRGSPSPEGGYSDVWLPTAGDGHRGRRSTARRADQLASRLWLNVDTNTGDRARPAAARRPLHDDRAAARPVPARAARRRSSLDERLASSRARTSASSTPGSTPGPATPPDPWAKLVAVARAMRADGAYTDGGSPN